jgi:segregation and condensation protein A
VTDDRAEAGRGVRPADPPGDILWDDWETPLRVPSAPVLHLEGFDGPLDLLVDLAERQRLDLGRMSIATLVDQFIAASAQLAAHVAIERRADWLVMTARLVLLRSRLLFPQSPQDAREAERDTQREIGRIESRRFVRAAAAWLEARPQLGQDVFARGVPGRDPRAASYFDLMEACLLVLQCEADDAPIDNAPDPVYRLTAIDQVRIDEVLRHIRRLLADDPDKAGPFEAFLPPLRKEARQRPEIARSAVAATLIATLELCRTGEVQVAQDVAFGTMTVSGARQA